MANDVRAPRARRPLVLCALALLAGSLAGSAAPAGRPGYALAAAAVAGFLAGADAATRRRLIVTAGLALLALVQALRASEAAQSIRAASWVPGAVEGSWSPLLESPDASRGRLRGAGSSAPIFQLPAGAAVEGERLRLTPAEGPLPHARGLPTQGRQRASAVPVRPDEVERLAPAGGTLRALRAALAARCDRLGGERTAGLARALLLGDRTRLDPRLVDVFTRTGLRHLLAVSGLHVGLFAACLALPVSWLLARAARARAPARSDLARALAAAGVVLYAPLAGGAAPVRRAALAFAVTLAAPLVPLGRGRHGARCGDGLSAWSAALLLELGVDPSAASAIGVQLSYAATLGLLVAAGPFARTMLAIVPARAPSLQPTPTERWRRALARRLGRAAFLALSASTVASLATLPLVWTHFGEWSPVGVAATPLALLLLAWILPAGWVALLAPQTLGPAVLEAPIAALVDMARHADTLPGTPVALPERPAMALIGAGVLAIAALSTAGRSSLAGWTLKAAALAWSLLLLPWHPQPLDLELVALDVGHGTAVALRAPGWGVWIFDAGSRDRAGVGPSGLGPLLARWDPGRIAVVLSHDQRDHASGLAWLVERRPPWLWAGALPAPLGERLPHSTLRLDLGPGQVELPRPGGIASGRLTLVRGQEDPGNEGSVCLQVAWNGRSALLSGDAEAEGLREMLASGALRGPVDVLLLPHHGSHTPWLGALLEAARPREAWISGSGVPPTSGELTRRGQPWRSTALEGPLTSRWGSWAADEDHGTGIAAKRPEAGAGLDAGRGIDPVRPDGFRRR